MACEDFPCCGHELGCCPDFDESGKQLNMICTCGAVLPVSNGSSLCDFCILRGMPGEMNSLDHDPDGFEHDDGFE